MSLLSDQMDLIPEFTKPRNFDRVLFRSGNLRTPASLRVEMMGPQFYFWPRVQGEPGSAIVL